MTLIVFEWWIAPLHVNEARETSIIPVKAFLTIQTILGIKALSVHSFLTSAHKQLHSQKHFWLFHYQIQRRAFLHTPWTKMKAPRSGVAKLLNHLFLIWVCEISTNGGFYSLHGGGDQTLRHLLACLGNICRSPAAPEFFRDQVNKRGLDSNLKIDSAGPLVTTR